MTTNRQRWSGAVLITAVAVVLWLLLSSLGVIPSAGADDPTPDNPECDNFYAYEGRSGNFGPSLTGSAEEMYQQIQERRTHDCLLAAAHIAYASGMLPRTSDAQIYQAAQRYAENPRLFAEALRMLEGLEQSCRPVLSTRSGRYETLAMRTGASPQVMPTLYKTTLNRGSFDVLVLDCGGERKFVYKIDCGAQPVVQYGSIPYIPSTPVPPTPPGSPPGTPPNYPPPTNPPPTTNPPTTTTPGTTPTTPTTTPTDECPPGYDCKDPVPPTPATCALPDNLCQPGAGPPTPRPPDPVQPTPTVAPPASTPPPPDYTVPPSDPDPSTPVSTPQTAPD